LDYTPPPPPDLERVDCDAGNAGSSADKDLAECKARVVEIQDAVQVEAAAVVLSRAAAVVLSRAAAVVLSRAAAVVLSRAVVNVWLPETWAEACGAASAGAAGPLNIFRFRKPKPLTPQQLQRERGNLVQKFEAESNALYEATKHVSHADAGCTAIIMLLLLLLSLLLLSLLAAIVAGFSVIIMLPTLEFRHAASDIA
jgi:hypothetical protein